MTASEKIVAEVRAKYGNTIHDLLAQEKHHGSSKILGAIEVFLASKTSQELPTSKSERIVFALMGLTREARNNGLSGFFSNSAGDYWKDALDGLVAISDKDGLLAFNKALSIFPNSTPSEERSERTDQLDALNTPEGMSQKNYLEALGKVRSTTPNSKNSQEASESFVIIELDRGVERTENTRALGHWDTVTQEYNSKPYPDWNLVYEYVKNHADDFNFEKA